MKKILSVLWLTVSLSVIAGETNGSDLSDLKADVASTKSEVHLLQQRVTELFQLRDHEISIASEAVDKRLAQMNEFRAQLDKQAGTFMTKDSFEARLALLVKQIDDLQLYQANQEGRLWMLGAGLALFFTAFNGIGWWLMKKNQN